ncbi:MAG: PorT family protein [Bacteroidales bacterium]|nr:PorT family protein [Bacteroidales bacterium]
MIKLTRIFILLAFLVTSFLVSGQSYVGIFGGLNSSKLNGDAPNKGKFKGLIGANMGAYIDLNLGKGIFLSIQPSYSQEGTKISYTVPKLDEPVDSITIRLNYFSLPLLLKVTSTNKRFYALGGLETGLLLNSFMSSHDIKEDIKADVAEFNIAMHFGAGFRIPVGYPKLFVELRYTQGLVNLTDEPYKENIIPRVKTAGFKVLVGIEIPLKKTDK